MVSRETLEGRERGVFTDADRDFLDAPDEFDTAAAYERKKEIKKRLANALIDLAYFSHTDDELRAELLEGAAEELADFQRGGRDVWVDRSGPILPKTVLTLYEFIKDERPTPSDFDRVLSSAVTEYSRRQIDTGDEFLVSTAEVDIIEPGKIDVERAEEKLEAGSTELLDREELKYLAYTNRDDFRERMDTLVEDYDVPLGEAYRSTKSHFEGNPRDYEIHTPDEVKGDEPVVDEQHENDE